MEEVPKKAKGKKYKHIPKLASYRGSFNEQLWSKFPSNPLPKKPVTNVNYSRMKELLEVKRDLLTESEYLRGLRVFGYLTHGAPAFLKTNIPAIQVRNEESAYEHGEMLTDTLADWVESKFVCGPFKTPPVQNFRANQLKVVEKNGKVRPIINASSPVGRSLNDNIKEECLEKIIMSSAKQFSKSILEAGKGAKMSKFDLKNAYKNVPAKLEDLRIQGIEWGGRYFIETTQMFGAKTAVANFDVLGHTILSLALSYCSVPRNLVHRQIDDVPIVAPRHTVWCEEFSDRYRSLCKELNVELAEDCPNLEKAFSNKTRGTVLGIEFDTTNLAWRLPKDKRTEYMNLVNEILEAGVLNTITCESLLGKLNFVTTMAPFMKSFKKPLNNMLSVLVESGQKTIPLTEEVVHDLKVWWAFLKQNIEWSPIADQWSPPPIRHKVITTDAAGWAEGEDVYTKVGVGSIGLDEEGRICLASQLFWEGEKVFWFKDGNDKHLGCKTTTLEMAGILVPFLMYPDLLTNQHVVVQVDNIGCYYAWENGYSNDDTATILVRTLRLVSAYLSTVIHVVHHRRKSSWESLVADRLTREKTTSSWDKSLIRSFSGRKLPQGFEEWMKKPVCDWRLPVVIVKELENIVSLP